MMSDVRTLSDVREQPNAGHVRASDDQEKLRHDSRTLSGSPRCDGVESLLHQGWRWVLEVLLLVTLFFIYAGDSAPMVNEAHYLVKAKNYWDPGWCSQDIFVASDKVHTTFYFLFGWPTKFCSLTQTAWLGRLAGWVLLAVGLQRLSWGLFRKSFVSLAIAVLWISGVEYGNLAGEWVIGGIEAKVPAYGLILFFIEASHEIHRQPWKKVACFCLKQCQSSSRRLTQIALE